MWSKLPHHDFGGDGGTDDSHRYGDRPRGAADPRGSPAHVPDRPTIVDDPPASSARPPRRSWVVLGVASYGQFAFSAYLLGLGAAAPVLQRQYGLTLAEVSILLGAANFGPLACALAWGVANDRFGERWAMTVGLTVSAFVL